MRPVGDPAGPRAGPASAAADAGPPCEAVRADAAAPPQAGGPNGGPAFVSLLGPGDAAPPRAQAAPACFGDLGLDQVVASVAAGRQAALAPWFHAPLADLDTIAHRQAVFRDLEDPGLRRALADFVHALAVMRAQLPADGDEVRPHRERRLLGAILVYGDAVQALDRALRLRVPTSPGLRGLRRYVAHYVAAAPFRGLVSAARQVHAQLSGVRFGLRLHAGAVTVAADPGGPDYAATIEALFDRFRRPEAAPSPWSPPPAAGGMNHVEAQILQGVARLHPGPFAALHAFAEIHADYLDPVLVACAEQVQFYLAWLAYLEPLRAAGLSFCYPVLSATSKEEAAEQTFDLALAAHRVGRGQTVVPNDFHLQGAERILVVTGANQGGKTTFARTVGQLHYLASLGCPVPGRRARLLLCDRVFTHFERQERLTTGRGRLRDDLLRLRRILSRATSRSLLILNEAFSSTTPQDALFLGSQILRRVRAGDLLCVCVTFLDELAAFDASTVSLVASVDPRDPEVRTFRVERRPADGLAHALAIARKHRMTGAHLQERLGS